MIVTDSLHLSGPDLSCVGAARWGCLWLCAGHSGDAGQAVAAVWSARGPIARGPVAVESRRAGLHSDARSALQSRLSSGRKETWEDWQDRQDWEWLAPSVARALPQRTRGRDGWCGPPQEQRLGIAEGVGRHGAGEVPVGHGR